MRMPLDWLGAVVASMVLVSAAVAQPSSISTQGPCSSVVTGDNATVQSFCMGISPNALARLNQVLVSGEGRKLFVAEAWLTPSPLFAVRHSSIRPLNEQAFVTVRVVNLTPAPMLITAAKLEIVNGGTLAKGGGIEMSKTALWPVLSKNVPIQVGAGADATITLAEGIELRGIADHIGSISGLDDAYTKETEPLRINGDEYIDQFSRLMSRQYGKDAHLRITLYEGDYRPVARLRLPLAHGVDFMYRSETVDRHGRVRYVPRLAYDAFLGEYLRIKERWQVGFRIKRPPVRVIEVTPDDAVPGGLRYRDLGERPGSR